MVAVLEMKPIILFRKDRDTEEEMAIAAQHFDLVEYRAAIPKDRLVIGRYSCLPYFRELEADVKILGSSLINTYKQHSYVADITNYYADLEDLTFKTWFRLEDIPEDKQFVLKGLTNSRKHNWKTHMFAANKREAIEVASRLYDDPLINSQGICVREFVPLNNLMTAINGMPISEEYRFFVLDRIILGGAFYWSSHIDELSEMPQASNVPQGFLDEIVNRVGDKIRFFVVDIAKTASGKWIVVELNDGCMSGLSENNSHMIYQNMKKALEK